MLLFNKTRIWIAIIIYFSLLFTHWQQVNAGQKIAPKSICSQQNLETLTTNLLRDLPNYANRTSQRARRLSRKVDVYSYIIFAGKPDFTPLPLNPYGMSTNPVRTVDDKIDQVFFTTLERQYTAGKAIELQQFHRLLLTQTNSGWRKVMMFTKTGAYPANQLSTPLRESSDGAIGKAVDIWLRDCEAGSTNR
ncbi:hypothetical protein Cal6303_5096 [Calothrix sp. PCC 6303]|nr:hypothetical protein Cal6303_5096 [Calothrix sp. PCC 6303]